MLMRRALAAAIDVLVVWAGVLICSPFLPSGKDGDVIAIICGNIAYYLYRIVSSSTGGSTSIGKRLVGIRIVATQEHRGFQRVITRESPVVVLAVGAIIGGLLQIHDGRTGMVVGLAWLLILGIAAYFDLRLANGTWEELGHDRLGHTKVVLRRTFDHNPPVRTAT